MSDQSIEADWPEVDEPMARQILHQSETFMRAQLDTALAADLRAVTVASILLAFSSAVIGAAILYWTQSQDWAALIGGLLGATAMAIGSCFCFYAARPVQFYFPGNHPEQWWGCRDLAKALIGETENYQTRISHNGECLDQNAVVFSRGIHCALAAPFLGFICWAVISWIWP